MLSFERPVLVTGAGGLIGQWAVRELIRRGYDAIAVSRRPQPSADPEQGGRWIQCDLLNPQELDDAVRNVRPGAVLHAAWYTEHGRFWASEQNLDWVAATVRLARGAVAVGCRRFVGVGTCYEYDWPSGSNCDEFETPTRNRTLYDTSKDCTRRLLTRYFEGSDVCFAWGRVFHTYGSGEPPSKLTASVAERLNRGEPALCSSGTVIRDYMDVRDVGQALACLLVGDVAGCVNIGTGDGVSVADLALTLGRLAGRPDLIRIGALPDREGEPPRIVAATNRLRNEVGFTPQISLEDGLNAVLGAPRRRVDVVRQGV